jgi:hypothetical protein
MTIENNMSSEENVYSKLISRRETYFYLLIINFIIQSVP